MLLVFINKKEAMLAQFNLPNISRNEYYWHITEKKTKIQ